MISREQYLEFAKKNEVPMELMLEYYNTFNEKKHLNFSLETFTTIFSQFLNQFKLGPIQFEKIRAHFDRIYNITTVYDKKGNFLTIY